MTLNKAIPFLARFLIGDKIYIDDCESILGTVTAIVFRRFTHPSYEISYIFNGDSKCFIVEEFRLRSAASDQEKSEDKKNTKKLSKAINQDFEEDSGSSF